jgi:hypothetical protein
MMIKTPETFVVDGTKAVLALAHLTLFQQKNELGERYEEIIAHLVKATELLTNAIKDSCDTEGEFLATTAVAYGMAYGDSPRFKEEVEAARKPRA